MRRLLLERWFFIKGALRINLPGPLIHTIIYLKSFGTPAVFQQVQALGLPQHLLRELSLAEAF